MSTTKSKYYTKAHAANAIASFPEDQAITGTITVTAGQKILPCAGTNTTFANIKVGDYVVLKTTTLSEVHLITKVDDTNNTLHIYKETANAHSAVNIMVIKEENDYYAKEDITIALKAAGTALYINGNVINPTDLGFLKIGFKYVEPIVVEYNAAFAITNAKVIGA